MALLTSENQLVTGTNRTYLASFPRATPTLRLGDYACLTSQLSNTLGTFAATTVAAPGETFASGQDGVLYPANAATGDNYLLSATWSQNGAASAMAHRLVLFDVLWSCSTTVGSAATTLTINSSTWPARDVNGTTNGEGVYIMGFNTSVTAASWTQGSADPTISYTNSQGVSGRTGEFETSEGSTTVSLFTGTAKLFSLQGGDTGVRSIQSITTPVAFTSGSVTRLYAVRPLCVVTVETAKSGMATLSTIGKVRLFNGTSILPFLQQINSTASSALVGFLTLTVIEVV